MTPTATTHEVRTETASAQNTLRGMRREHEPMFAKYPRNNVTKEMIMQMVEDYGVQFVDLQFIDLHGVIKFVTVPVHQLESAIDNNVWFDGSSIKGFSVVNESDMALKADLDTFAVLPWTLGSQDVTARLICDVLNPDGSSYEGDPRAILRRQVEEAKKLGFASFMGSELEYFLFKLDVNGEPTLEPQDKSGYFGQYNQEGLSFNRDLAFCLDMMGIEIERMHHEVAVGQSEVNYRFADVLRAADNTASIKFTIKALAKRHGLHATFMAKPVSGINGSGMHVHQSLSSISDGVNKFYDPAGTYGLSPLAQSYIAGQLQHVRAMNAVLNPTVNSYKRLVVGYETPVNVAWGKRNRSALIRIPHISPALAAKGSRIELRCPDPSSNPYLAFAVMLASGLDGVRKGLVAPAPVEENLWEFDEAKMDKMNIQTVTGDLGEALKEFAKDEVIRDALGEHTFRQYYDAKFSEWDSFRLNISKWEIDRYLDC